MKKILYILVVVFLVAGSVGSFLYFQDQWNGQEARIASLKTESAVRQQIIVDLMVENGKKNAEQRSIVVQPTEVVPMATQVLVPLPTLEIPTATASPTIIPVIIEPTPFDMASIPSDATAACRDGTFYFRHDYKHVCENHGGYWWWKYEGCTKDSC